MKVTTEKHFEIFKRECEKWIKRFGLLGHRFYYIHADGPTQYLAYCICPNAHQDRVFTLGLSKTLNCDYSMINLKRAAFHEVMEAFLYRLNNVARCRYVVPEEIEDEVHNIIRTLENVVFEGWK
jgi:hypothetical protein